MQPPPDHERGDDRQSRRQSDPDANAAKPYRERKQRAKRQADPPIPNQGK